MGYGVGGNSPSMMWMSVPQIPQASTLTTICPGPGAGSGTCATRKLPGRSSTTARMSPPTVCFVSGLAVQAGAGLRVEREDILGLDTEGDLLPGGRRLASLSPGHHRAAPG